MQESQQQKSSFIPPAPAPKDSATGFAPQRFPVQTQGKQPSASGKVTRAYSSYQRDLIQAKLLEGMDKAIQRQTQTETIQPKEAAASQKLRAVAYTSGNRIAFAKTPSVGLAAHEAAHVMQQQSGKVQLKDGLGQVGDKYEQHVDAVADAVVAGKSAEPLFVKYTGDTAIAISMPSVMAKAQRASSPLSDKEELQAVCLGGSCPPLPEPEIPELTSRHYYIKGRARETEATPETIEWTNGLAASYALNVARGKPDDPIVGLPNDMNIWDFKEQWVRGYLEVIKQAATTFEIPSILVAGIAFREVGGDPPVSDPLAYGWRYSTRISREDALRTSYGNLSIQIRRAMESLGYDSALTTGTQLQAIRESLLEPRQNIFIAAQHMSDLRNIDFPGKKAADLTRGDIMVTTITMVSCSVDDIPFLGQSRPQPISPPEPINCPEIPTVDQIPNTPVSGQVYGRNFSLDKSDISLLYLRIQHGNLDPQAITVRFSFDIPVGSSYFDPVESSSPVKPIEYYTSKAEGTTYAYGGRYGTERESIWDYRVTATEYVKNLQDNSDVDHYMLWDYSTSLDYPDYRVFVQIGQRQEDYLPGKLYLCIPEAATEIQGTFNAKLSPPNGTFVDD